ncbi:MAG TPA: Tol-Pal system beta propeller repeat protein TolB [Gammaproteobacteria bacterium]|nr:Tol-Pal system beta propeller repeat protein TolB [Gammaproteobacteria bacterium]
MKTIWLTFLATLLCLPAWSQAALTITITQGVEGAVPVAVIPFGSPAGAPPPQDVAAIVAADLARSGRFAPLAREDLIARPVETEQVRFQDWRTLGAENLVIGKVVADGGGAYHVEFRLFDVLRGRQITGYSIPAPPGRLRYVAHRISDIIYEALTGEPGAFATRIAYVIAETVNGKKEYRLQLADSDGYDPQTLLTSPQPLMSPAWSPDARKLAYVSFENRRASIYVQDIYSGKREVLASFAGINGAPDWSPDGRYIALTLSRDGNPEIYTMRLSDRKLKRLTFSAAIDTEPSWSPDGQTLVFTSDRGGSPQLYRIPAGGGRARRITFDGNYNASADFSPDGRRVALVHAEGGNYRIATLDLEDGQLRVLSDGKLDESPSFAPNGSMIIYATESGHRGVLAAVSSDGRFRQRFSLQKGDVREPAWSPFRGPRRGAGR